MEIFFSEDNPQVDPTDQVLNEDYLHVYSTADDPIQSDTLLLDEDDANPE